MIEYTVKVYDNGDKEWWIRGKRHREDGPAIEYVSGDKEWWIRGKRHREDGPAIDYVSGSKYWYLKGKQLTEDEWKIKTSKSTCEGKEVEIDGVTYILKMKV